MHRLFRLLFGVLFIVNASGSDNSGNNVAVVYNSAMPESKKVADRYAEKRNVPANQIIGLNLPTSEMVTRQEFREQLQKPLLRFLEKENPNFI